jgi:hypothetical protein
MARLILSLSTFALLSCSSSASGTLELVTGAETDTFTQAPIPVKLQVDAIDSSGTSTTLATAALPASTVDLGSFDANASGIIQVSGFDASGNRVLGGQSIPILFGAADGLTLPVFIQRTGELARMPNPPLDSRPSPVLGVIEGRYVVETGGADPTLAGTTAVYDLASLGLISPAVALPITPTSMAFVDLVAWLIDDMYVYQYDFSTGTPTSVNLPSGPAVADISGGATVTVPDGSQYIVGGTRPTVATSAVLALDPSGNPSWATLTEPRSGASAAWVESLGLVVIGGSTTGSGVEVIATGATAGAARAYPPDPRTGSGAAALDGTHVLVAGGVLADGSSAGVRTIDLSCTSQCTPTPWPDLGATVVGAQVFAIDAMSAIVVGSEPSTGPVPGLTHVYQVTSATTTEVPTKVAHTNAGALASPVGVVGSVLLVGGAPEIESLGM